MADGDMALDNHGRVLRRPNWYSASEHHHLVHNHAQMVVSRDLWRARYHESQLPRPVKIRCRRKLIPLVKFLLGDVR